MHPHSDRSVHQSVHPPISQHKKPVVKIASASGGSLRPYTSRCLWLCHRHHSFSKMILPRRHSPASMPLRFIYFPIYIYDPHALSFLPLVAFVLSQRSRSADLLLRHRCVLPINRRKSILLSVYAKCAGRVVERARDADPRR